MPYPMWIPYKDQSPTKASFPDELRENWLEIEPWSELGFSAGSSAPFLVVAGDGSGDYLTPGGAIAAIAAVTPTIVYIKPGTYADTGPMNIVSKQIVLFGLAPYPDTGWETTIPGPLVIWNIGTATAFTSDTASELTISNLYMTQGGVSPQWTASAGLQLTLMNMQNVTSGYSVETNVAAFHSNILFGHSGAGGGTISNLQHHFVGCKVTTNAGATQTFTQLGHTEWIDCVIDFNTTLVFKASTATNNNKTFAMRDCTWQSDSGGVLTVDGGDWDQIHFVGQTNFDHNVLGPTRSNYLPTANFTAPRIVCSGNNLDGTDLFVAPTAFYLDGIYRSVVIDSGIGSFDLRVGENPSFAVVAKGLWISTDDCSGTVSGAGATDILYIDGSHNSVVAAGVPVTNLVNINTGTGNKIVIPVGATTVHTPGTSVFI